MRLRELRLESGLTQQELAARAGVCTRTITALEVEGAKPRRATLAVLATALGVAPVALERDAENDGPPRERPVELAGGGEADATATRVSG